MLAVGQDSTTRRSSRKRQPKTDVDVDQSALPRKRVPHPVSSVSTDQEAVQSPPPRVLDPEQARLVARELHGTRVHDRVKALCKLLQLAGEVVSLHGTPGTVCPSHYSITFADGSDYVVTGKMKFSDGSTMKQAMQHPPNIKVLDLVVRNLGTGKVGHESPEETSR